MRPKLMDSRISRPGWYCQGDRGCASRCNAFSISCQLMPKLHLAGLGLEGMCSTQQPISAGP